MPALLIIKEDDAVGSFFKKVLEEDGSYSVTLAKNGEVGIALAREISPSVVVTDLFLPGLNGVAVAQTIKADPQLAHIPIIILTKDLTESEAKRQLLEGKCDRFFTTPVTIDKLKASIEELLEVGEERAMLICPACETENEKDATNCAACGEALPDPQSSDIQTLPTRPPELFPLVDAREDAKPLPDETIVVLQMGERRTFFPANRQVTIGRRAPGGAGNLVDLNPHGAHEFGVSRHHARIQLDQARYLEIIDLGSANGTLLNGVSLQPFHRYRLANGDWLHFGGLTARISFRKGEELQQQ